MSKYLIDQYKKLHAKRGYGPGPAEDEIAVLQGVLFEHGLNESALVLDYGCGRSRALDKLFPDAMKVYYDPAIPGIDTKPKPQFDCVICTDVMEHIPEDEVYDVLLDLSDLSDNVVFVIHTDKAFNKLPDGQNCHATIQEPAWWVSNILDCWDAVHTFDIGRGRPVFGAVARS